MPALKYLLCVAVLAVSLRNVQSETKDDLKEMHDKLIPHIGECSKEYGLAEEDLKEAKKEGKIDGFDPCFFACVLKRVEFIDKKGLFDVDKVKETSKEYIKDEKDLAKIYEVAEECSAVNSEEVSDGEEGCERSKLLLACLEKNKGKLWPEE